MKSAIKLRNEIKKQARNKPLEFKAVMGRVDGMVKASQNDVYVTLYNGDVITVYNDRIPRIALRKIIIGYDKDSPLLQVLRFDDVYDTRPTAMIVNHKNTHAWYSHDPIDVYAEQFLPLLPRAIGGLIVRVYGGSYLLDTQYHLLPATDFDLTAEVPASGAEWVSAEVNSAGVVTFTHGTNKTARELLLLEDVPTVSSGRKILFAAKMYEGMSEFIQTRTDSDIFDPRFTGLSSGGLASAIDWNAIFNKPVEEELTSQITGSTDHFDLSQACTGELEIFCNIWQPKGITVLDDDGLGFTMSYKPTTRDRLIARYSI